MRTTQLEVIIDSLMPKLYGFSYALVGDKSTAEQVIIDAYTVFVMRERDFIAEIDNEVEGSDRVQLKKYFFFELLKSIFTHVRSREKSLTIKTLDHFEYDDFYCMKLSERALLYLKEVEGLEISDLQEVFSLQRHQVLELIHNSKYALSSNISHSMESVQ